jgi:hypothetical protein
VLLEVASRMTIGASASDTEPVAAAPAAQPADEELVPVSERGDKTQAGGQTDVCPSPTVMHNEDLPSPISAPPKPFIVTTPSGEPVPSSRPQPLFSMEGDKMHVDFARLQQMRDEELGLVFEDISLGKQRCLAALASVTAKTGSASTIAAVPSKPAEFEAAPKRMSPGQLGSGREGTAHGQQRSLAAASATSKAGSATKYVARRHVAEAPSKVEEPLPRCRSSRQGTYSKTRLSRHHARNPSCYPEGRLQPRPLPACTTPRL